MNRHVGPYHCAAPSQMPPDRAPISKAPANTNENEDPAVGQYEYWARSAIRDLVQVKGYDNARHHIAMILTDLAEGRRS